MRVKFIKEIMSWVWFVCLYLRIRACIHAYVNTCPPWGSSKTHSENKKCKEVLLGKKPKQIKMIAVRENCGLLLAGILLQGSNKGNLLLPCEQVSERNHLWQLRDLSHQ